MTVKELGPAELRIGLHGRNIATTTDKSSRFLPAGLTRRPDAAYSAVHFLLLKIASSVGMGLVLKQTQAKHLARLPVIRVNYAVAAVLAFACSVAANQTHVSTSTAVLAVAVGVLFVAGIALWAKAIEVAGLASSVVAMRTGIVIPVIGSALFWRESPNRMELAGAVLALLALALVLYEIAGSGHKARQRTRPRTVMLWLSGLFLADGLVMLAAQVFSRELPQNEALPFQAVLFVSAFVVTTVVYYARRARIDRATLSFGALLGTANLGNYLFLVMALTVLPGVVVYPAVAAGEVSLMALAGVFIWREQVGIKGWFGIGLAVLALILLQVGRA